MPRINNKVTAEAIKAGWAVIDTTVLEKLNDQFPQYENTSIKEYFTPAEDIVKVPYVDNNLTSPILKEMQ